MQRTDQFAFQVNKKERDLIVSLAKNLQRSQSDAVRFVVTEAAKTLQDQKTNEQNNGDDKK
jgi:hypothetical protein